MKLNKIKHTQAIGFLLSITMYVLSYFYLSNHSHIHHILGVPEDYHERII